jgi:hypothetical protein
MASPGEIAYHHFIIKLAEKATSHFITVKDVHNIGSRFWGFMSMEFKDDLKKAGGKNGFWNLAVAIKNRLLNNELDELFSLWQDFDSNGKNMFENLYNNCILHHVSQVIR